MKFIHLLTGLIGWIVANGIIAAIVWFATPMLNPFFYQLLSGREISEFYASSILSSVQLLINIIPLILLAYTRRFILYGALIAFAPALSITLCLNLFLGPTFFGSGAPPVAYLEPISAPMTGPRIAFNSSNSTYSTLRFFPDRPDEIYVMRSDGSGQTRLTYHGGTFPVWSPDGKEIAFVRGADMYIMNADGTFVKHLARLGEIPGHSPKWSPDGDHILIEMREELYVMNADGTKKTFLTGGVDPAWSPDGKQIAFDTHPGIYVVNFDGTGNRRLGDGYGPAWSPDSKQIAFTSKDHQVYVVNVNGNNQTRLGDGYGPAWSPDSKQIAFTFKDQVYIVNVDGSGQKRLADGEYLAWSPDGKRIALNFHSQVYVVNVDGTGSRQLEQVHDPQWSPDGKQIAFVNDQLNILVMNADGTGERILTKGRFFSPVWSPR